MSSSRSSSSNRACALKFANGLTSFCFWFFVCLFVRVFFFFFFFFAFVNFIRIHTPYAKMMFLILLLSIRDTAWKHLSGTSLLFMRYYATYTKVNTYIILVNFHMILFWCLLVFGVRNYRQLWIKGGVAGQVFRILYGSEDSTMIYLHHETLLYITSHYFGLFCW